MKAAPKLFEAALTFSATLLGDHLLDHENGHEQADDNPKQADSDDEFHRKRLLLLIFLQMRNAGILGCSELM
jgi:hypothetical protein